MISRSVSIIWTEVHTTWTCLLHGQLRLFTLNWCSMAPQARTELSEKLEAILGICQKMNSERDLGSLLDLIAREATNLLACDRASIFLLDRERNELWSKVAL